jgi:hypothetical protein
LRHSNINAEELLVDVVNNLYQCLSGFSNAERNWEDYASLFSPDATIFVISNDSEKRTIESKTVSGYIDYFTHVIGDRSFYEKEVARRIEFKDSFAVYWSDYEARLSAMGDPIYTGTNCFQLYQSNDRWLVISILWERKLKPEFLTS